MKTKLIYDDICSTLKGSLDIEVKSSVQIHRGWMNLKWIVETNKGKLFIKQFNKTRFSTNKMMMIKERLKIHDLLSKNGVLCPQIIAYKGDLVIKSEQGEEFIITDAKEGSVLDYGKINENQIRHLGECIGQMHFVLNEKLNETPNEMVGPGWQLGSREDLLKEWQEIYDNHNDCSNPEVKHQLMRQKEIFESMDLDEFADCRKGWSHSDLWSHNIHFTDDKVSGLLDFDRVQYSYPETDIARALLSLALNEGEMDSHLVDEFINGYSKYYSITRNDIRRAIKLMWCEESFWWIREPAFNCSSPPERKLKEMIWIMDQWEVLMK